MTLLQYRASLASACCRVVLGGAGVNRVRLKADIVPPHSEWFYELDRELHESMRGNVAAFGRPAMRVQLLQQCFGVVSEARDRTNAYSTSQGS